jgi:PTH1 family peptidyl-tRNA hydrolase
MVVDEIARRLGEARWRKKNGASSYLLPPRIGRLVLVKPMEFMNESGPPLLSTARFYRVPPERILVISDDLDLPFGKLRMRPQGGHGGHNGLRSIIAHLGDLFPRLRIGVGRPPTEGEHAAIAQVLGDFNASEREALPTIVTAAAEGALLWFNEGIDPAMRQVNIWRAAGAEEPVR